MLPLLKTEIRINKTKTVKVGYGKNKKLFELIKTPPFKMDPIFTKKETLISLEEQRKIMQPITDQIEKEVTQIEEEMMKIPFEVMQVNDIRKKMKELKIDHFIDAHFPPKDISIYNPLTSEYPYKKIVHWRRPKEFMKTKPVIFHEDIDPNDIKQGFLGNCWFLCAVACLAERPELVRRLFITKEYNDEGIYRLKICKNGEWISVTVDDYIPCYYNGGPMFARSIGDELWVMLLEKAYAKVHGNYLALKSGFSYHAMIDLSGCPTEHIKFASDRTNWDDIEEEAEEVYEKLLEADEHGYLISASTPGKDKLTTGEGKKPKAGLVPGHAYSIIKVQQHEDIKLIQIRNPWGKFEWDGDWSDKSELWTEEMLEIFDYEPNDTDGSFWMSLEDFYPRFKSITFCQVQNWQEVRLRGKFIKVTDKGDATQDHVISKFYYTFDIEEDDTNVVIGIHQEDKRNLGSHLRPYLDTSFIVLKRNEDDDTLDFYMYADFSRDRELFKKITFEEGSYVLVPFTSGTLLQRFEKQKDEEESKKTDQLDLGKMASSTLEQKEYFASTMNDIFRKIDLTANGILSAKELNQFGRIVDNKKFQDIKQSDFTSEKFKGLSCTKEGLTRYGFFQYMFKFITNSERAVMLNKLGYDKMLHSLKSRVFVITFQAEEPMTLKINDILEGNMHKTATNIFIDHLFEEGHDNLEVDEESNENVKIVKYQNKYV